MGEELYRQCSVKDPNDFEANTLIELLNDEDCPHLITVEELNHVGRLEFNSYTLLELLCKTNNSRKLKQCIEIVLLKHEKKNGPIKQESLNGTRALDFICQNPNQNKDLLDIAKLLVKRTRIDFNRQGLRLQQCFDHYMKWNVKYNGQELYWNVMKMMIKEHLLLYDFNEYNFDKPEFKISDLFQKYLNPLKRGPPFLNHNKAAANKKLFNLYATVEEKAMLQILPHLEPNLEENVPILISHLDNLIEAVQFEFDRLREDFYQNYFQISNIFKSLFFNKRRRPGQSLQESKPAHCRMMIELMLEIGLNINARDYENEMNALHLLLCYYKGTDLLEITKLLIKKGIYINTTCSKQKTVLHYLLSNGNDSNEVEIAKLLIEKGINVNAIDEDGKNSLHSLCSSYKGKNSVELGKILLENRVDVNAKDTLQRNALHCLCEWSMDDDEKTVGTVEMIKFLIDRGIDVNAIDCIGRTPLHCLSAGFHEGENRVKLAKLLLNNNANINEDGNRRNALLYLLSTFFAGKFISNMEMLKLLIENGIDVHAKDQDGKGVQFYLINNKLKEEDKTKIENLIFNQDGSHLELDHYYRHNR